MGPCEHGSKLPQGFYRVKFFTIYATISLSEIAPITHGERSWEALLPLHIRFLDLEKTFDCVPHNLISNALPQHLVPEEFVS